MTSWDQQGRGGRSGAALETTRAGERAQDGQPSTRRAARERERRAAEGIAQNQAHPSGVVDFTSREFGQEYSADQDFNVGDTTDIWAALSRRADRPEPQEAPRPDPAELARFSTGVPDTTDRGTTAPGGSAVSGELLDRVRGAVLRPRDPEPTPPSAVLPPAPVAPRANPYETQRGPSRREIREQQFARPREDEQAAQWFEAPRQPAAAPVPPAPQPGYAAPALPTYDEYDDEYYDEEYAPDPTIAIRALHDQGLAPRPATAPVDLPHYFQEHAGDDALRFSSPTPMQPAEPLSEHPYAEADASFIEPPVVHPPTPQHPFAAAQARAAMEFVAPEGQDFQNPQLGPPSEVTDLAGFEALIRQARSKAPEAPAPTPRAPQPKPLAWADDEDASEGFTGLLSRQIQGSHGSSNALILPEDAPVDLTQAVSPSGDPFITGSLNLSRSLSTTGASAAHYESADIDRLYDASQDEPAAGVAPVRASKAVAGAGASRSFSGTRRTRGNVLPTVLAIIAGAMAVGVVTLLVGSWVLRLF